MANLSQEQITLMLEKRIAAIEAALGINPDPATVINRRFSRGSENQSQQQTEEGNGS